MTAKLDGTNGVIFPDGTTQGTAAVSTGVGQTWQAVTRTNGSTYTNSTGKPIMVLAGFTAVSGTPTVTAVVAGTTIATWVFPYGTGNPISFIIPVGSTYSITWAAGTNLAYWNELR